MSNNLAYQEDRREEWYVTQTKLNLTASMTRLI